MCLRFDMFRIYVSKNICLLIKRFQYEMQGTGTRFYEAMSTFSFSTDAFVRWRTGWVDSEKPVRSAPFQYPVSFFALSAKSHLTKEQPWKLVNL